MPWWIRASVMRDRGSSDGPAPERRGPDLLFPGLSGVLARRGSGFLLLGAWLALLALAVYRRRRIAEFISHPDWSGLLALACLAVLLAVIWRVGNRATSAGAAGAASSFRFHRSRRSLVGAALLALLGAAALLAPLLAPFDPDLIDLGAGRLLPPSLSHWMGTDELGRDLFSRVLYGARVSLLIGFLAVAIAVSIGTAVGAAAGYSGGWLDALLMRIVDLFLSFPRLVLLITVVALFQPSIPLIIIVLGLTGWMGVSRLVRGQVLSVREREYVQAARAMGYGPGRILGRHVLPNVATPIIVAATLGIGNAILAEAALSYLGLGVQPPVASWGTIIQSGGDRLIDAWWIATFPGLAIVVTVMSFNLVGDSLRDALDPRRGE
jgi:peptide/nickel transport system permease protein